MPKNLLLNYLDEVRKQREYLLNKWQLTSPSHLESVDSYAHKGTLQDYVYRLPWLRVPDKGSALHLANLENLTADLQKLANAVNDLEKYSNITKGIVHIIQDDGEIIEVVPSSNPDSPPVDKEQVTEISRQATKKIEATEDFHDVSKLASPSDKDKCLPALMEADIFQESLSKLPRLEALCERLKPKPVADPLAASEIDTIRAVVTVMQLLRTPQDMPSLCARIKGCPFRHELRYVTHQRAEDIEQMDVPKAMETFHKLTMPSSQDTRLLEEPEGSSGRREDDHRQTEIQMISPENRSLSTEIIDDLDRSEEPFLAGSEKDHGLEKYETPIAPRKELLELNSEGVRERKKLTEALLFETTIDLNDALSSRQSDGLLKKLKLDKEDVTKSEEVKVILSPSEEKHIDTMIWNTEKNYLHFPSLRLQEPNTDSKQQRKQEPHIPHQTAALERLQLRGKAFKIALDSALSWNPVCAVMAGMNKMAKKVEIYQSEEGRADGDIEDGMMDASKAVRGTPMEGGDKIDLKQFTTWDEEDKLLSQDEQRNYSKIESDMPINSEAAGDKNQEALKTSAKLTDNAVVEEKESANQEKGSSISAQPPTNTSNNRVEQMSPKPSSVPSTKPVPVKAIQTNSFTKEVSSSSGADAVVSKKEIMMSKMINPLEEFLMLRTVPLKREAVKTSPKKPSKIIKKVMRTPEIRPSLSEEGDTRPQESQGSAQPEMSAAKKSKSKVVEVTLTDSFVDILGMIDMATQPILNQLRKMKIISASYSLSSLTPDITRFLLKQQEKMQDTSQKTADPKEALKLRCLLQLHALITTADLIMHCDLTTAILHLSAVQEKYFTSLEGCLDNIRQTLYQKQCVLHKEKVIHPKLMAIIKQVADWYKRKITKEGGDHDPKILVIIKRETRKLVEVIAETLAKVQGITTAISQSTPIMYDTVSKQLDSCNCLVLIATQIGQDFPWALFSLVVEYEHMEASPWMELCQRQNIRRMALKTMPITSAGEREDGKQEMNAKDCLDDTNSQSQSGKTLKLIASEDVILCSQLLQVLESKHEIMLLERNYSKMTGDPSSNKLYYADLIVDERTGIILQHLHQLSEPNTIEPLVDRITKLSLQYSICWLILYRQKSKNTGYPLGGQAVNNLAKLQAALAQFSSKTDGYEAKVLFADNLTEVAQLIRQVADNAAKTLVNWHETDWLTRRWLTNTVSKHEKVLLQFPCLNAFSAQVMLTAAPLKQLLTMPLPELLSTCPWIPHKNLQMFHSLAHGLQENLPHVTKQQPTKTNLDPEISTTQLQYTQPSTSFNAIYSMTSNQGSAADNPVDNIGQSHVVSDVNKQQVHGMTSGQSLPKAQSRNRKLDGDGGIESRSDASFAGAPNLVPLSCRGQGLPVRVKQECDEHDQQQVPRQGSTDKAGSTHYSTSQTQDPHRPFQDMSSLEFITRNIKQEPGIASQSHLQSTSEQRKEQNLKQIIPRASFYHHPIFDQGTRDYTYAGSSQQQYPVCVSGCYGNPVQMESASGSFQDYPKSSCYPEEIHSSHYHHLKLPSDFRPQQRPSTRPMDLSLFTQQSCSQVLTSSAVCPPLYHQLQPHRQSFIDSSGDPLPQTVDKQQGNERGEYWTQLPKMQAYQRNTDMEVHSSSRQERQAPRNQRMEFSQTHGRYLPQDSWYTPRQSGGVQDQCDQSVPSSAEVDKDDTYLADGYDEGELGFDADPEMENQQVPLTPSKKRRLTYERVPGAKGGQTRLAFY